MKRRNIIVGVVLLLLVGGAFAIWPQFYPSGTWRYRLTVNIQTPEGVKSGSAVREVSIRNNTLFGIKLPEAPSKISTVKGEAVVIDLGKRGVLFALINRQAYMELYRAFPIDGPATTHGIREYNKILKPGMKADITQSLPTMVTFKDIDDPKSVALVRGARFDPESQRMVPVEDFEKILGHGVSLKSVIVEVTNEPVTSGVVGEYLTQKFWQRFQIWVKSTKITEREFTRLFSFEVGENR